ncbi:MAG TPA: AtpZ/AtpI family protein [Thermoanaerobaculia bacterium]|jgi:F0F1-type ATP synthase assembly protein I
MPERPKPRANWVKLSGLGIELAAAVVGLSLFGYWWDRHFGTSPWGLVVGGVIGVVGGMYNLIRQSLSAIQEAGRKDGDDGR